MPKDHSQRATPTSRSKLFQPNPTARAFAALGQQRRQEKKAEISRQDKCPHCGQKMPENETPAAP